MTYTVTDPDGDTTAEAAGSVRAYRRPATVHCARCQGHNVEPLLDPWGWPWGDQFVCDDCEGNNSGSLVFSPGDCECDECWPVIAKVRTICADCNGTGEVYHPTPWHSRGADIDGPYPCPSCNGRPYPASSEPGCPGENPLPVKD